MALRNLRPDAQGFYNNWTLGAGATKTAAVDPLNPIAHDDATTYVQITEAGSLNVRDSYSVQADLIASAILAVTYGIRLRYTAGAAHDNPPIITTFARLAGVNGTGSTAGIPFSSFGSASGALDRPGGGAWTVEDITDGALEIGFYVSTEGSSPAPGTQVIQVTSVWITVEYNPTPLQLPQAREIPSRRLRMFRRPDGRATITGPLELLDIDAGDTFWLSHKEYPEALGAGAGLKDWQRQPFVCLRREVEPARAEVTLIAQNLRNYWTLFWDVAITKKTSALSADGIARLDAGGTRSHTRTSQAWIEDPSDGRVVALENDQEKNDKAGLLIEHTSTNDLTRSSFVSGTTGITLAGTGTNGSAIAVDTGDLLFDPAVTPNSLRFTAGNPHSADLSAAWAATASITGGTTIRVSIDHKTDSGEALRLRLQRGVDSRYWNEATETWDVGVVNNALTSTAGAKARAFSKRIPVGAGATTVTLTLLLPSGGTASRISHVYHAQIEQKAWATSRIVTDAAAVTRSSDVMTQSNNSAARCWNATRGTFSCQVVPNWDAADVAATRMSILAISHDASNHEWLYYDGVNQRWCFERRVAGVTYQAVFAAAPVRGTTYTIACRWTSTSAEHGLTAFTASIFVNGVKGTDVVTGAAVAEVATVNMHRGANATPAERFDGHIHHWDVSPLALSDADIARRP